MGQKIKPNSLRLGIIGNWHSRWFSAKTFKNQLEDDFLIRKIIRDRIVAAGIVSIDIERNISDSHIIIKAARPGLVIGRGGKGVETLTKAIENGLRELHRKKGTNPHSVKLTIDELRRSEVAAAGVAQNIAWDLEKRLPYRRTMKKHLDFVIQNKEVKGAKIRLSGRLNGANIARREWLAKGKLPLQTLRADVDYAEATAYTTYGTIGVKVWIYKGEVFNNEK